MIHCLDFKFQKKKTNKANKANKATKAYKKYNVSTLKTTEMLGYKDPTGLARCPELLMIEIIIW